MTMQDTHVSLAHGNGGRYMRELIHEIFARHLANPLLDTESDAAVLPWNAADGELAFTTDSFTVQPIEFPGGNIGSLAVHGTTNDLAVAGAVPKYLSLGVLLEEGLEFAVLERVVAGIAQAAREIGVVVAAGDTKVVRRGEGGGIYLNTSGIGVRNPHLRLGMREIRAGDAILVSGPVGDHGIAVMLAREQFGLRGDLQSDAASVLPITLELARCRGLRFMRDPTRGGIATVMHEIVHAAGSACLSTRRRCRCAIPCARCARCSATTRISWPVKAVSSRSLPQTRRRRRLRPCGDCPPAVTRPSSAASRSSRGA